MFDDIVKKLLPVPFIPGGRDMYGLDCWGLVIKFYELYNPLLFIPDINVNCEISENDEVDEVSQREKYKMFLPSIFDFHPSIMLIKHNDPVYITHAGIYLGKRVFLHTRKKVGVHLDSIDSMAWKRKIEGYYVPREGK